MFVVDGDGLLTAEGQGAVGGGVDDDDVAVVVLALEQRRARSGR